MRCLVAVRTVWYSLVLLSRCFDVFLHFYISCLHPRSNIADHWFEHCSLFYLSFFKVFLWSHRPRVWVMTQGSFSLSLPIYLYFVVVKPLWWLHRRCLHPSLTSWGKQICKSGFYLALKISTFVLFTHLCFVSGVLYPKVQLWLQCTMCTRRVCVCDDCTQSDTSCSSIFYILKRLKQRSLIYNRPI